MKTLTAQERIEQEVASLQVLGDNGEGDHKLSFEGLNLTIYKDVFSPHYFNGWRTFTPALRQLITRGMDFLEIGVGSGVTALLLAKDGVNVMASDISPLAVDNTKFNARQNNINLNNILLSDVYDGFHKQYKFDAVYWNAPWMETLGQGHDKVDNLLEYGLFDNDFSAMERYIKESYLYLKPNGKLYIGHADFGDYKRLESLLDKYGYEYKVIASQGSLEIREVEFYLYEAQLTEAPNKIFISMPYTSFENEELIIVHKQYTQLAEECGLRVIEQRNIDFNGKDKGSIVEKNIKLIQDAHVMLADLRISSVEVSCEMMYASQKKCIPVIGFGCLDEQARQNPWYKAYCSSIVDNIQEALAFSKNYCKV